jgi:hypothetical protein
MILQSNTRMASEAAALDTVNKFVVAFFLVGIGFLILLTLNSNRRTKMKEMSGKALPKEKARNHEKGQGHPVAGSPASNKYYRHGGDMISQLPHMTREELKAMILKEKAASEAIAQEGGSDAACAPGNLGMGISEPAGNTLPQSGDTGGQLLLPQINLGSAPEATKSTIAPDVALLSSLLIGKPVSPSGDMNKEQLQPGSPKPDTPSAPVIPDPPCPPLPPHHGKVERSMLSNELPDEYKRKSRKI